MSLKKGSKVQVWNEATHQCLGWGIVIEIAVAAAQLISGKTPKGIPLIKLKSGKTIWGDRCHWIEEKKACEIGVRLFRDIHKRPGS